MYVVILNVSSVSRTEINACYFLECGKVWTRSFHSSLCIPTRPSSCASRLVVVQRLVVYTTDSGWRSKRVMMTTCFINISQIRIYVGNQYNVILYSNTLGVLLGAQTPLIGYVWDWRSDWLQGASRFPVGLMFFQRISSNCRQFWTQAWQKCNEIP